MKTLRLSIDDALLERAERLAHARGVSVETMVTELLAREAGSDTDSAAAARRRMGEMARRPDIPRRLIPWTREELYEERLSRYQRRDLRGDRNE